MIPINDKMLAKAVAEAVTVLAANTQASEEWLTEVVNSAMINYHGALSEKQPPNVYVTGNGVMFFGVSVVKHKSDPDFSAIEVEFSKLIQAPTEELPLDTIKRYHPTRAYFTDVEHVESLIKMLTQQLEVFKELKEKAP